MQVSLYWSSHATQGEFAAASTAGGMVSMVSGNIRAEALTQAAAVSLGLPAACCNLVFAAQHSLLPDSGSGYMSCASRSQRPQAGQCAAGSRLIG